MGTTLVPVSFIEDELTIRPHTASHAEDIGRAISIREFAGDRHVRIYVIDETDEYYIQRLDKERSFIEGPKV